MRGQTTRAISSSDKRYHHDQQSMMGQLPEVHTVDALATFIEHSLEQLESRFSNFVTASSKERRSLKVGPTSPLGKRHTL